MDLTNHSVDVPLTAVVAGPSRVGMKTGGMLVSVREGFRLHSPLH